MNQVRRQLRSMLRVEPRNGGFSATLTVDPGFVLFADHFRNNPILPGICLIQAVVLAGESCLAVPRLHVRQVKAAKFVAPVLPNDQVAIDAHFTPIRQGEFEIKATLLRAQARLAQLSLIVGDAPSDPEAQR